MACIRFEIFLITFILAAVSVVLTLSTAEYQTWTPAVLPKLIHNIVEDCEKKNLYLGDCMKIKFIVFLERTAKIEKIRIGDFVTLEEENKLENTFAKPERGKSLSANQSDTTKSKMVENLPESASLNEIMVNKISNFLSSRILKFSLPDDINSPNVGEARSKMKKTMGMFMQMAMMKLMMVVPMAIGVLFLLAGKALIISKIALVLSLIILMKKIFSKPAETVVHENYGWNGANGGAVAAAGGWDKRSYKLTDATNSNKRAQSLAYSSYNNYNNNNNNNYNHG